MPIFDHTTVKLVFDKTKYKKSFDESIYLSHSKFSTFSHDNH